MIRLVGILNITPDSFSDGGKYISQDAALLHAGEMAAQGASVLDVGGDSTRPGSSCVPAAEEWRRIGRAISALSSLAQVSVDTHMASTARRALESGAVMINDVSAGDDPDMFRVVSQYGARIVLMHSCCPKPHVYPAICPSGDIMARILEFFCGKMELALRAGIGRENIILDPGAGAFISPDSSVSFEVIERFGELEVLDCALMFGISRKGFLKKIGESGPEARDVQSAQLAVDICRQLSFRISLP